MAAETMPGVNGVSTLPLSPLDVLTLPQAAAYLQTTEDAVRAAAERGQIVGQRLDGEWRCLRESIAQWLRTPSPRPQQPSAEVGSDETPEEQETFLASLQAYRDEIDLATGSGKYAPE